MVFGPVLLEPSPSEIQDCKPPMTTFPFIPGSFIPLSLWPMANARFVHTSTAALLDKSWCDFVDTEFARLHASSHTKNIHSPKKNSRTLRRLRARNTLLETLLEQFRRDLDNERESRELERKIQDQYIEKLCRKNEALEMRVEDLRREATALRYGNESTFDYESSNIDVIDSDLFEEIPDDDNNIHSNEFSEEENEEEEEEEDDDDSMLFYSFSGSFKNTAIEYLAQSTLNNLTPAMTILDFDDLVLKYDPAPPDILSVLARGIETWCVDQPGLIGFSERWGGLLGRYLPDAGEETFLIELEKAFALTSDRSLITRIWMRLLVQLYKLDVVGDDAIIAWACAQPIAAPGPQLRVLCQRFVDFLERPSTSSSDAEEEETEDDENDEENEDGEVDDYEEEEFAYSPISSTLMLCNIQDCDHDSGCDVLSDEGCSSSSSSVTGLKQRKCVRFGEVYIRKVVESEEKDETET